MNEKNQLQIELSAEVAVKSRIVLTPEHAKRLMFALQENIIKYEKQFGNIRITEPENNIPPFMTPGGEA